MSKAKILMMTRKYGKTFGHDSVIDNLSLKLSELGYDVVIGANVFFKKPSFDISTINLGSPFTNQDLINKDFDLVHNHQTLMNFASLKIKKPFIFHYHGIANSIQKINLILSLNLCKNNISQIISVSNSAASHLNFTKIPINVIFNGVDTKKYHPNIVNSLKINYPQLLFVGRLNKYKNIQNLINFIPNITKKFPNAHLSIVGTGDYLEDLQKLVSNLMVSDKISFLGHLETEQLKIKYAESDIYVSSSLKEAYPVPPMEAMGCGKPILLSNIPAHQEIISQSSAGYTFSLDNQEDFLKKLELILKEKNMMTKNAIKFSKKYDWENIALRISKIYSQLL
jgi:glycosyltransferase involved in cell wall biosynthesis